MAHGLAFRIENLLFFGIERFAQGGIIGKGIAGKQFAKAQGLLVLRRHGFRADARLLGGLLHQQLIIADHAQLLCHALPNFTPAAAILAADANDRSFHEIDLL